MDDPKAPIRARVRSGSGRARRDESDPRDLCLSFHEEVWNRGNIDAYENYVDADYAYHPWSWPLAATDAVLAPRALGPVVAKRYRSAFPDLRVRVDHLVVDGDRVAMFWSSEGTHGGTFWDLPPSGKLIGDRGVRVLRVARGRIAEEWAVDDNYGILQQINVVPDFDILTREYADSHPARTDAVAVTSAARPPGVERAPPPPSQKDFARWFLNEVRNELCVERYDEFALPGFIYHQWYWVRQERDARMMSLSLIKDVCLRYSVAFAMRMRVDDVVADGDRTVLRWSFDGKHVAPLGVLAPTGRPMVGRVFSMFKLAGGKVAEEWGHGDRYGTLQQLGVLPDIGVLVAKTLAKGNVTR